MIEHCATCGGPLLLHIVEKDTCLACDREFEATGRYPHPRYSRPDGFGTFLTSLLLALVVLFLTFVATNP